MAEVFSAERIDPSKLSAQAREALTRQLYPIQTAVFAGLNEEEFDHYVVNSPAKQTKILLYRNEQNELVGYFGVHRFEKHEEERPIVVFRGEVGLLPGYRQKRANIYFWLTEAVKFKLLHPGKRVYFFYAPVSPSFYAMVARHIHKMYPRADQAIPPHILELMTRIAQEFGLNQVEERDPLVREVGWITKATNQERNFWQSSRNRHIRFYIEKNPKFSAGHGLLTLIPLTVTNAVLSLFSVVLHRLERKLRIALASRQDRAKQRAQMPKAARNGRASSTRPSTFSLP